jgi:hypothetical protein
MRNLARSNPRPPRLSRSRARAKFATLFDTIVTLEASYEELLWLRERVALLSRGTRKKVKPSARKCVQPRGKQAPKRPRH